MLTGGTCTGVGPTSVTRNESRSRPGRGFGTSLLGAAVVQLRHELMAAGMAEPQIDKVRAVLDDPPVVLPGHPLNSTNGRKPGGADT